MRSPGADEVTPAEGGWGVVFAFVVQWFGALSFCVNRTRRL